MHPLLLHTERLTLRSVVEADWEIVHKIASHPRVKPFVLSRDTNEQFNKMWALQSMLHHEYNTGDHFAFMICLEKEPVPIGVCSLSLRRKYGHVANLGWNLDPAHWGHGYATESAQALVKYGFEQGKIRRIIADCYKENKASRRVMEKIGMRQKTGLITSLSLFWQYDNRKEKVRYELKRNRLIP